MKIALYQMKMEKSIEENINKSFNALKQASNNNADLILYPEIQLTHFFPQFKGNSKKHFSLTI